MLLVKFYKTHSIYKENFLEKGKIHFFAEFFFNKSWELVCKINILSHKDICFKTIQNGDIKLSVQCLSIGFSLKVWRLRSTDCLKFTEEGVMCTEKHIFVQKKEKKKQI